jgi:hypothetical protein
MYFLHFFWLQSDRSLLYVKTSFLRIKGVTEEEVEGAKARLAMR